jgi:hypothetical protein
VILIGIDCSWTRRQGEAAAAAAQPVSPLRAPLARLSGQSQNARRGSSRPATKALLAGSQTEAERVTQWATVREAPGRGWFRGGEGAVEPRATRSGASLELQGNERKWQDAPHAPAARTAGARTTASDETWSKRGRLGGRYDGRRALLLPARDRGGGRAAGTSGSEDSSGAPT